MIAVVIAVQLLMHGEGFGKGCISRKERTAQLCDKKSWRRDSARLLEKPVCDSISKVLNQVYCSEVPDVVHASCVVQTELWKKRVAGKLSLDSEQSAKPDMI